MLADIQSWLDSHIFPDLVIANDHNANLAPADTASSHVYTYCRCNSFLCDVLYILIKLHTYLNIPFDQESTTEYILVSISAEHPALFDVLDPHVYFSDHFPLF